MNRMMIRYRTRPEAADENQSLIEGVFRELNERAPTGVKYAVLRLEGDVFVHLVDIEPDSDNPLNGLDAFQAFQNGLRDRYVEAPTRSTARMVGNFGMLSR